MVVVQILIAAAVAAGMVWCVREVVKDVCRWVVFFREKKKKESGTKETAPEPKPEEKGLQHEYQ